MPHRILVADHLAQEGLEALQRADVDFLVKVGLSEQELANLVCSFDALIVRSGAKVTPKVLENCHSLRVVARAGVGVDNIDLDAATAKGVLVLNTAEASTISTAEHAIALMLALARKIPQADAHVRSGEWKRSQFQGTQLAGKTLGIVGLGRIGRAVATRALAMEMNVVGFDPYFSGETALEGKVRIFRDFDTFLANLDVITFHVPGGESTRHLLSRERLFGKCRPNLLVINDSRGEVIDELALADALVAGKVAGAAIDVFQIEPPPKNHPIFAVENTVLTPHLGASTEEAQTAVSVDACEAVLAYLASGEIRGAVNAGGIKLDLPPDELPLTKLASRIGRLLTALCDSGYQTITLRASGAKAPNHMQTLLRLAAVELLDEHLDTPINVINVEYIARQRGIELVTIHEPAPPAGLAGDIVGVRVDCHDGTSHRILGTVYADALPRVLRINDFNMDMIPEGQMVLLENRDEPGVIGFVGTTFGNAAVNIADMVISRQRQHDGAHHALMVIKTDSAPPGDLIATLRSRPNILRVKPVKLPPRT